MCKDCGCGKPGLTRIDGQPAESVPSPILDDHDHHDHPDDAPHAHEHRHEDGVVHSHPHDHEHTHDHAHPHHHDHGHPHSVEVNQAILSVNDRLAERNRGFFKAHGLLVLNVVSSPGSGKTTLLQKTVTALKGRLRSAVIVGDLETDNDANRLRAAGATAVQITTGTLCHLEAGMVARAMGTLDAKSLDLLIIENVGNLVCPAGFDLGEDLRVVLLSVTEGEDKPLKYPPMFHSADAVIVTKMDLAQAVEFDRPKALENIRRVSPRARIFEVSAKTGSGLEAWCDYLVQKRGGSLHG